MVSRNPETSKFKFNEEVKELLASSPIRENITEGTCDFCHHKAVQGKSIFPDVFLVCEFHKK